VPYFLRGKENPGSIHPVGGKSAVFKEGCLKKERFHSCRAEKAFAWGNCNVKGKQPPTEKPRRKGKELLAPWVSKGRGKRAKVSE